MDFFKAAWYYFNVKFSGECFFVKKFLSEFKEFIARGNVMDMAVGIIVGSSFTAIVTSLVNDIFMPIIGLITGGINFAGLTVGIGGAQIAYGNFIQVVINFVIVAFVIFCLIKAINQLHKKEEKKAEETPAVEEPSEEVQLLREIRDSLKK